MKLSPNDRRKLLPMLDKLAESVEELLLSGLTTASEATRQALGVSFQEAARLGLLRLSPSLRAVNEELGRFTRDEAEFSRKRLSFFLNRAWLLSRGLARALRENNEVELDRLLWTPGSNPVERLEVVTLGVVKRATPAYCALEFHLRTIQASEDIPEGYRLIWAYGRPVQPGKEIPAEGLLYWHQKQKFKAAVFLEGKTVILERIAVALDGFGGGRISLGDASTVTVGDSFKDWERFQNWDTSAAVERIQAYRPGPLDLGVELQEEVVLDDWQIGEPTEQAEQKQIVFPILHRNTSFAGVVPQGPEGKELHAAMLALRKKKTRPPLFGLLHYEMCRLMLQPVATLGKTGLEQLMLSKEKIDQKALVQSLF